LIDGSFCGSQFSSSFLAFGAFLIIVVIKMIHCRTWLFVFVFSIFGLSCLLADADQAQVDQSEKALEVEPKVGELGEKHSVYVIPITGAIDKANLYILRRGLKEALVNEIDVILLDMDTPGGRVDVTLDMMKALDHFDGITATFINEDAISAGSFIAASTQEIYFAPRGKMGASAVIQGGGEDVPETARKKIESYLRANIRVIAGAYPYRSDVIRAMLDEDFELKIGDEVIKPEGELLTLTAPEALQMYGDPARPLLGEGIYDSTKELLDARFGEGNYVVRDFEITYSEEIAKWMNTFAPALMGIGMLLLFLEFKTPGFGIFGIGGITCIAIFFASQYVAGLAGNELILFFVLGVILVLVEIFFLPGTFVFAASGLALMLGSLLWAMVDVWPGEAIQLSPDAFAEPLVNLIFGVSIAFFGLFIASRLFPSSWMGRQMILAESAGTSGAVVREERLKSGPSLRSKGGAITDLFPSGHVEIQGKRYDARSQIGQIEKGSTVRVVRVDDFGLIVEEVES